MEIEVALTAWTNNPARLSYFENTMEAIRDRLTASRHTITRIIVASEELTDEYRGPFEATCRRYELELHYHPAPAEIGRNHNLLLSLVRADYVLSMEDDCMLNVDLDLSDHVEFLEDHPNFLMTRYFCPFATRLGRLTDDLEELDTRGPCPYSNLGHLRHRERFATLGPYTKDAGWGGQEIDMGGAVARSGFHVAARVPDNAFNHIGRFAVHEDRWPEGETP